MEISLIWCQWITALIFSIAAFIWKKEYFFPMFAGLFWLSTAYSMVQIHYLGFGSQNVIIYDHEMDDWYGDVPLFWLTWACFMMFMIETFIRVMRAFKGDGERLSRGETVDYIGGGER